MAKLILLLLIGGSLALFAASNLTPTALVILGIRTQALPLAVWILGALLAGGFTTVLLSGFSSISKGAAVRRANQPRESRSPWTAARSEPKPQSGGSTGAAGFTAGRPDDRTSRGSDRAGDRTGDRTGDRRAAQPDDDWERDPEVWDNWDEPTPGSRPRTEQTEGRTRIPENRPDPHRGWDEYEDRVRGSSRRAPSPTGSRAESRSESRAESRANNRADSRTDRTGSGRTQSETRKGDVYDAEYRVLIPPYSTPINNTPINNTSINNTPTNPVPPPSPPSDEEDWGLDDDEPQDRSR